MRTALKHSCELRRGWFISRQRICKGWADCQGSLRAQPLGITVGLHAFFASLNDFIPELNCQLDCKYCVEIDTKARCFLQNMFPASVSVYKDCKETTGDSLVPSLE